MKKIICTIITTAIVIPYIVSMEQNTAQLYANDLTEEKLRDLQQHGVDLTYKRPNCDDMYPLKFWLTKCSSSINTAKSQYHSYNRVFPETKKCMNQAVPVLLTLLEANTQHLEFNFKIPSSCNVYWIECKFPEEYHKLLWYGIWSNDDITIKRLLDLRKYPLCTSYQFSDCWNIALQQKKNNVQNDHIIDLLLSTPEDIQEALNCTTRMDYNPDMMLKLIKLGADPSQAILYSGNRVNRDSNAPANKNDLSIFQFLTIEGGFDKRVLHELQEKKEFFTNLIDLINTYHNQ